VFGNCRRWIAGTPKKKIATLKEERPLYDKRFAMQIIFCLFSCFFPLFSLTFAALTRGGVYIMLIIPIKDGENIDRALKRYKRKFDKTGTVRQLRARQAFIKPSVTNRMKIQKAAYIQNMRDNLEN